MKVALEEDVLVTHIDFNYIIRDTYMNRFNFVLIQFTSAPKFLWGIILEKLFQQK